MHRRLPIALATVTCLSLGAAQARTLHVAPLGDDGGPGTAESPLRTIQKAAEVARAGDVVLVRTGVYKGHVYLRHSGEPDRPVVFRGAPGEKPVVDGEGKGRIELQSEGGWRKPIGWVTVEGFEVRNGWDGIKFYNAHHIVLKDNSIHDNLNQGILGNGHHVRIEGNTIFRNGIKAGSEKSNLEHGIYATGTDFEIIGNVIHSNRAYGIQVAGYPFKPDSHAGPEFASARRWLIRHNTIALQQNRAGIVIWQEEATDCVVENNLFFKNAVTLGPGACQGIDFVGAGGGHVIRSNFFFGPDRTSIGKHVGHAASDNLEDRDPLLIDADRFDFRLRERSPAIGYGAAASPTAYGACEPWASDTHPTDVPRSHVEDVTTSPFTYHIRQGGTMDGKMCTTLPGVWEPFEQTWESNRSIRMENVGAANVVNPWLKVGPIDFFSQQSIAESVVAGLSTDREKALAIFHFYIRHRYHKGNGDNGAQGDVSQAINVFGFNTCGNSTLCLSDLLDKVGMKDCIFSHCPGHCVPQAFFDGRYNTLDGDMATLMLLRDNHTIANELDLVRDHDLIKRVHQYGIMRSMDSLRNNEDYAQYYTWEGDTKVQLDGWAWWTMAMVLRPHEAIEWRWGHENPVKYHGDMNGYPPIAPDTICNGVWEYEPDLKDSAQWRAGASVTNVADEGGVLTARDGGTGTIVWAMKVPYQFIGGELTVAGEGCAFEIGFLDPKDWKTVYTPLPPAEFDAKFRGRTAAGNEYWLRCTLKGNASLRGLKIKNDIQMAPLAMPAMTVGDNAFTYSERTNDQTGSSASRKIRIAHEWVERSKTRPPGASPSPAYPADGGASDGTDVVFRWSAAVDPDGDAIADYHFQLSDRSDMRWPLSPNFDKYISRTPEKGSARYAVPRPGLLTPGTLYHWRVKAKDAHGVWGPWSATWSFTAQGPGYPVDVALRMETARGVGTLTWNANPVGREPARYRVYGSDEKGFTVHDAPYEVKLGDTDPRLLASPFPSNFVAEVTGTSLDVLGVGNPLPNANKAYYRVVAVDGDGKRSGDSEYVDAPRPFIYSVPVTVAPVGKPYRYPVKAIRSIGDLTRRDNAKPTPGTRFWKIEPLKFSLSQKPAWMSIDADTGLITGTSDGTGGAVIVNVTLTREHRLVHDENAIVWGNEWEKSKTYETLPATQHFVVDCAEGR